MFDSANWVSRRSVASRRMLAKPTRFPLLSRIEVIEPVLMQLRAEGMDVRGPVPADTAFAPQFLANTDVVVAMYHDQGLPVLKAVGFGNAVNMTLGLPILRTSVDHGTALALARTGAADVGSLRAAFSLAVTLTCRPSA